MDTHAELSLERAVLVKADVDIRSGEDRIRKLQNLLSELQINGRETREADRLLRLLRLTLVQWQNHRTLMVLRIQHLEALAAKDDTGRSRAQTTSLSGGA